MKSLSPETHIFRLPRRLIPGWFSLCLALLVTPANGALEYLSQKVTFSPDPGYQVTPQLGGTNGVIYGTGIRAPLETALVSFRPDGSDFRVLHEFGSVPEDGSPGSSSKLIDGQDGHIYGFSINGGTNRTDDNTLGVTNGTGMIFRLKLDGSDYRVLHTFPRGSGIADGGAFPTSLVIDPTNQVLYGTAAGGQNPDPWDPFTGRAGLIFRLSSNGGDFEVVRHFQADYRRPATLSLASGNVLLGIASPFQNDPTALFRIETDGSGFRILANKDFPTFLFEARNGQLYFNTTEYLDGLGGLFRWNSEGSGSPVLLYQPEEFRIRNLFEGKDGGLYGFDEGGTIFRINPDGTGFIKLAESAASDVLVEATDGALYSGKGIKLTPLSDGAPRILWRNQIVAEEQVLFYGTRTLTLTSSIPNAKIFYTTDGSPPSSGSQPYVFPFDVVQDTTLRTIAYASDLSRSAERPAVRIEVVPAWSLKTVVAAVAGLIGGKIEWQPEPAQVVPQPKNSNTAEGFYPSGTTVTLRAVPRPGWEFARWEGAGGGISEQKTFTLNSDTEVTAVFAQRAVYKLNTYIEGADSSVGDILGNGPRTPGVKVWGQYYFAGTVVELTPVPSPGWTFFRWAYGSSSTEPTLRITMDRHRTIGAFFGRTVEPTVVGSGTVEVLPHSGPHRIETQVTLVGHPAPGNFLAYWGVESGGSITPVSTFNPSEWAVNIPADYLPVAAFTVIPAGQVLLEVKLEGRGNVRANPSRNTFTPGQLVDLTAVPATGEVFHSWKWTSAGQNFTKTNTVLRVSVTTNTTVTARFGTVPAPPTITVHPRPVTVIQGYPASFNVVAGGGEPRTYQWWRGGVKLPEDAHFKGATNATLTIAQVNPLDAGSYTVEVRNASGSVTSNPAILTVLDGQADTDGDGLRNGEEGVLQTDPTLADTDGDGLNDFREARELGTNPRAADTDGDGFADGTEVAVGTDPKDGSESPDGHLTAYFAVELEFYTLSGKNYQLQQSTDLQTWTDVGAVFAGTGNLASRFVSTRTSEQTYWRLQPVP